MKITLVSTGLWPTVLSNSMTISCYYLCWQRVDTWGVVPDEALSCNVHPRDGGWSIHKAASIQFAVCKARDGLMQNKNFSWLGTVSCMSTPHQPDATTRAQISHLPTGSDHRPEVGKAAIVSHDQCERHLHQGYGCREMMAVGIYLSHTARLDNCIDQSDLAASVLD